jgi:hypothetical protein
VRRTCRLGARGGGPVGRVVVARGRCGVALVRGRNAQRLLRGGLRSSGFSRGGATVDHGWSGIAMQIPQLRGGAAVAQVLVLPWWRGVGPGGGVAVELSQRGGAVHPGISDRTLRPPPPPRPPPRGGVPEVEVERELH